jgi:hypothetical protein
VGFGLALGFPADFDEALIYLPGYFAGLLIAQMKSWAIGLFVWAA